MGCRAVAVQGGVKISEENITGHYGLHVLLGKLRIRKKCAGGTGNLAQPYHPKDRIEDVNSILCVSCLSAWWCAVPRSFGHHCCSTVPCPSVVAMQWGGQRWSILVLFSPATSPSKATNSPLLAMTVKA
jgi:hypothetical protein